MSLNYGFTLKLSGSFDHVVSKTTEALATEGFGIVSDIDMQATLKKKINVDRLPYKILGACNPGLANKALEAEPDIGLLLPCNVVVREQEDGSIIVSFLDPGAVFSLVGKDEIAPLAEDVKSRLLRVAELLTD